MIKKWLMWQTDVLSFNYRGMMRQRNKHGCPFSLVSVYNHKLYTALNYHNSLILGPSNPPHWLVDMLKGICMLIDFQWHILAYSLFLVSMYLDLGENRQLCILLTLLIDPPFSVVPAEWGRGRERNCRLSGVPSTTLKGKGTFQSS